MLTDKVAVVTGASRGIGQEIAKTLAAQGATVIVNYNGSAKKAAETIQEIETMGGKAEAVQCDVSDFDKAKELLDYVIKTYGHVDILVNNAGITRDNLMMRMSEGEFDAVIRTNLRGTFLCMKAVSRLMLKQRYGRIVNLSSVVGLRGNAGQVNYAASKAGVIGLTKALAKEVGPSHITVNCVAPGVISTEMNAALDQETLSALQEETPLERIGSPEDAAHAIVFLASEKADFITGQVISPNGGFVI